MTSRFASLTEQDIEKIVEDTDLFFRWVYNNAIIRFGFCDIQNNRGLGKGYQPQPSASADNPHLDLDYSGYHKTPSASADNPHLDLDYYGNYKNLIQ